MIPTPFEDMVCALARVHSPPTGFTVEDLEQIGRIAVWEALKTWNPALSPSRPWVKRRVQWALAEANRTRDKLRTVSLDTPIGDEITLEDAIASSDETPEEIISREERSAWLERAARGLTAPEHVAALAEEGAACKILGVSRQRANQLRHSAISKLRRAAARDKVAA